MEEYRGSYDVRTMCEALGVSASGYYGWRTRPESERARADRRLLVAIRAVHHESGGTYGALRVHAELKARGVVCGKNRVARLMREHGVRARLPKRRPKAQAATPLSPVAENVLGRRFQPAAPDVAWVADITYIPTGEGWLYLSVVLDLFSRRVVGWSARPSLGRELAIDALMSAVRDRRPEPGLLHHSDQGTQYTSSEYRDLLRRHGLVCSMSRRGKCLDNAPAESFFGTLKTEVVRGRRFETQAEARSTLFTYLESFYNTRRRHSALGYLTPEEYERRHAETRAPVLAPVP